MSLQSMLDSQLEFQKQLGYDIKNMSLPELSRYIKDQVLWSTDELHEMIHEVPFAKDWSKKYLNWGPEEIDRQLTLAKEEFIDHLLFTLNIANALGLTEEKIVQMYKEKNKINIERQETGY